MSDDRPSRLGLLVPNGLTALRLAVAATFPFSPHEWRLALVFAGAVSDALDGYFARKLHSSSWIGALLDGVTDKLFTLSVLLTLTIDGPLVWWQLAGLLARDVVNAFIAAYVGVIRRWEMFRRVSARTSGKVTTMFLFAMMVAILWRPDLGEPLVWVAVAASILTAADYLTVFVRWRLWKVEPAHLTELPPAEIR